jgi:Flp pilus assembly pilin Flp
MGTVRQLLLRLVREEDGGEAMEYALVAVLITVVSITAISSVGTKLTDYWRRVDEAFGHGM